MSDLALSEEHLIERLSALVATDGSPRLAVKRLAERGITVTRGELEVLRDQHGGMYMALAAELSHAQEEAIAQEFRELARLAQRGTRGFLENLNEQLENGTLDYETKRHMPQIVQALAKVQQVSVDKLLSITGRPQDGGGGDVLAGAKALVEMGVLVPKERPADVDGTAEEAP